MQLSLRQLSYQDLESSIDGGGSDDSESVSSESTEDDMAYNTWRVWRARDIARKTPITRVFSPPPPTQLLENRAVVHAHDPPLKKPQARRAPPPRPCALWTGDWFVSGYDKGKEVLSFRPAQHTPIVKVRRKKPG